MILSMYELLGLGCESIGPLFRSLLLLLLVLSDKFFLDIGHDGLMFLVFHGEFTLSLSGRSKFSGVAEHVVQRDISSNVEIVFLDLSVDDSSLALVQATNNGTLEFNRSGDGYVHNRFQNDGFGLGKGIVKGCSGGNTESQFTGIDGVSSTIFKNHADSINRMSNKRALFQGIAESFLAGGDKVGRDVTANNTVVEISVFTSLFVSSHRLD